MEEQFLTGSRALDLEISPLHFQCRYHFICFSTSGWGGGNSPFFNLQAFSIADQALPRQKTYTHVCLGCLLCRLHSSDLSYLLNLTPAAFSFGGTRASVIGLTPCWWHCPKGCCGDGTTLSHRIRELPGMNGSDAASLGEASASPSTPKRHKTPGVMGTDCECPPPGSPLSPASSWQKSPGQALAACPRSWGTGVENAASGKKKKGTLGLQVPGEKTNKQTKLGCCKAGSPEKYLHYPSPRRASLER